jgi:hypothetical protein
VAAFHQVSRYAGLSLGVERRTGDLDVAAIECVIDSYSAGDRLPICIGYGHRQSLCAAALRSSGQCRSRGYALRACRNHRHRQRSQSDTQSSNQLKPQTAAVYASHVHLLQIS